MSEIINYLFSIQPYFIFGLLSVCIAVVYVFMREAVAWFRNRGNHDD